MKLEELSRLLLAADPAAVLVPAAALERVIKRTTGAPWALGRVPHARCFLVDRHTLFKYVEQDELDIPPDHQLPLTVLLLERPSAERLASPRDDLLARYWRLLFHVAVHRELETKVVNAADVRRRVERLGPAAFEEAKNVLTQDRHLDPKADDRAAYIEFVAFYLELRTFAWNLIPVYFPSLPPTAQVDALLADDLDAEALAQKVRPAGAPNPNPKTDDQSDESHDYYFRLERAARRAAGVGDTVGAAILHTRAARVAPVALTGPAHAAAVKDIHHLVDRLRAALGLDDYEAEAWRQTLPALLDKADQGTRPVEAAILFDLQRACLDHEQKIYTLDVVEWLVSAGHKPIKRELDSQRFVRVPAHLRTATRRLTAARLSDVDRQALAGLLRDAQDKAEDRLRKRFRPVLTDALHDAGLRPASLPEEAALAKTVEELLDKISTTGFLTFAELRDAIARGQVKLPDLGGPDEYLRGDLLLRLDRRLATLLDGVYRRSEFYTRWLERLTSLGFGTETGRWVTRNVLLPFGGAFLAAEFVWLLVFELGPPAAAAMPPPSPVALELSSEGAAIAPVAGAAGPAATGYLVEVTNWVRPTVESTFLGGWNRNPWFHAAWLVLAVVLLAFIRSPPLQAAAARAGRLAYRAGRFLVLDLPVRIWNHPVIHGLLTSWPFEVARLIVIEPAILSTLLFLAFPVLWETGWPARAVTVLATVFLLNHRVGREAKSLLFRTISDLIEAIRRGLIPGLIKWIAEVFRKFTDTLEWLLARGDDWLRLRGGGGTLAVVVRAIAGLFWFPLAFVLRFYLVVLIEPMINPLKLPLSLLFAKFVYPLLAIAGMFEVRRAEGTSFFDFSAYRVSAAGVETLAEVMPYWFAFAFLAGTFYLLPDAVTYLFWETRENWRLYRANRPRTLRPVPVGPHGESVVGLLRPGFHSGTVPRLYAKLRSAERRGAAAGIWQDARAHREALREVAGAVARFVARDLAAVLNPSPDWGGRKLTVGKIHVGTNRIQVELQLEGADRPAVLEWEERSGWLVAGWAEAGWVAELPAGPARALGTALAYLYKRAGVHLVRDQVRAELPATATRFDIVPAGLLVWYGPDSTPPVLYDVARRGSDLRPRTPDNLGPAAGPILSPERLVFDRIRLTWTGWLGAWGGAGFGPPELAQTLLPAGAGKEDSFLPRLPARASDEARPESDGSPKPVEEHADMADPIGPNSASGHSAAD